MYKKLLIIALLFNSLFNYAADNDPFANYKWQTITAIGNPVSTEETSFIVVKDKFYLLGGRKIQATSIFDPKTNTWTFGAEPPIELHHFQSVVYKNKVYVICALTGKFPHEKPVSNIYIYDPHNNTWEIGDSIPLARQRGSAGTVLYRDKIYLTCGIIEGHWDGHVTWMDEYDPKKHTWKVLPDAPRPRDHFDAVTVDHKIYCIGGRKSFGKEKKVFELTVPEIDMFDFKTQKWTTLEAKLPTERAGGNSVVIGNDILVIGGESIKQLLAHNEVEAFNIKTQRFRTLSPLVEGRHGTSCLLYNGKIYTTSGAGKKGGIPKLLSIEYFSDDK